MGRFSGAEGGGRSAAPCVLRMGGRRSLTTETRRPSGHCGRDWRDVATGQGVLAVTDQILEEAGLGFSSNASRGSQPCLHGGLGPWKPVSEYRAPELVGG